MGQDASSPNDGGPLAEQGLDAATDASLDASVDAAGPLDLGPPPDFGMCVDPPLGEDRDVAYDCAPCRPDDPPPFVGGGSCDEHSDCTEGVNGRCVAVTFGLACTYDECFTDTDCEANELCQCGGDTGLGNRCVRSNCRSNADCGDGVCAASYAVLGCGFGPTGWYCQDSADDCASDEDCTIGLGCYFSTTESKWTCGARPVC